MHRDTVMSLDEGIENVEKLLEKITCDDRVKEYKQLKEWLLELKEWREITELDPAWYIDVEGKLVFDPLNRIWMDEPASWENDVERNKND